MTVPEHVAQTYHDHAHQVPVGQVSLTYEDRFLRRKVLGLDDGRRVLVDLPKTTSLNHGGVLVLENGSEINIVAAPEPLLQVKGQALHRLAWHFVSYQEAHSCVCCTFLLGLHCGYFSAVDGFANGYFLCVYSDQ